MKLVVQRVRSSSCWVDGAITGHIDKGLLVLIGFCEGDTLDACFVAAKKIANLRIFEDETGKMNKSVLDVDGGILSISQFTLCADTTGGNRPSFTKAMHPDQAVLLYRSFNVALREVHNIRVEEGVFKAEMVINLENDGPVTIILEF